jgi:hypothetical protein
MWAKLWSRARLKPADRIRPKTATASSPAIRDTALFTPEATPASLEGTASITAVVSGATLIAIPMPKTTTAGKNVLQYEPPIPGREKSAKPAAATTVPTVSGNLAPYRATSPPDQRESMKISRISGSSAAPAWVAE